MQIVQAASPLWQEQIGTQPISYAGAGEIKQKTAVATTIKATLLLTSKTYTSELKMISETHVRLWTFTSSKEQNNNIVQNGGLWWK
jgi:hypothetical protein